MVKKLITYSLENGDTFDLELEVELTQDVYFYYLFRKEFNVDFNPLSYLIDRQYKKFYNKFCDDWMHNKIDEREIIAQPDFYDFLKKYFEKEALGEYFKKLENSKYYENYVQQ